MWRNPQSRLDTNSRISLLPPLRSLRGRGRVASIVHRIELLRLAPQLSVRRVEGEGELGTLGQQLARVHRLLQRLEAVTHELARERAVGGGDLFFCFLDRRQHVFGC